METTASNGDTLLTTKEVAAILSVKPHFVWHMVRLGQIRPVLRLGRKTTRFRKSDVMALFNDQKPAAAAAPNI